MTTLHYFNPGHEYAVLNRLPSYTPPSNMTKLMRELASLPAWYADKKDIILVGDNFDIIYHQSLLNNGFILPIVHDISLLSNNNKLSVCLWGIAPKAIQMFKAEAKKYSVQLTLPRWDEEYIYLNSRMFARDVLAKLKSSKTAFSGIMLPVFYSDIQDIKSYLYTSSTNLLVKSPYSSSGKGLLWLGAKELTQSETQIIQGMLNKQEVVSLEPIYDKVIDFAMEFMSDGDGGISFVGYSLFSTNVKGAYLGNILLNQADIISILCENVDNYLLEEVKSLHIKILLECCASVYKGCIGVDMMIYIEDNIYKIHPCIEVNMRYNMGYLSLKLQENHICNRSKGIFNLDFDSKGDMLTSHNKMEEEYPLIIDDGRVKSGYLSLCPVVEDTCYRAYILIEELQ